MILSTSTFAILFCLCSLAACAPYYNYQLEEDDHYQDFDLLRLQDTGFETRHKRQVDAAVTDALNAAARNGPVGQPTFGGGFHGAAFHDKRNFGARVGGNVGATVWQDGNRSVGAGLGGRATGGLNNGRPFVTQPDVGGALNYRNGPFSVGAGVGYGYQSPLQRRPGMTYGVGLGYRF